ncbi:MAG: adenosylmethionine--8-amino-7-oxononanoate transaminase [Alphaproteobacteria bacterium]|nr:adenosylmethionine--8-amino-7-oxononanoate transaminase [Alphaproteobacteria bacterium]OJV45304.1 MAG: adenosylmethionine--8-amino-7-oxononanoate transaminase [Alphaproteobacteria bacterium 43-37]
MKQHIWYPFTQMKSAPSPILITRGEGAQIWDEHNKSYLDLISSWWVNIHGHCHPKIAQAIADQAHTLEHVLLAGFTHKPAQAFSNLLCQKLDPSLSYVFFGDNGSTAVEIALKMAIQYWSNQGHQTSAILHLDGGYHGDTFGSMAVGKTAGLTQPFHPFLFKTLSFPTPHTWVDDPSVDMKEAESLAALQTILDQHHNSIAAIIVEPLIQGAIGMRYYRPSFLDEVIKRCKDRNILIIFDEVMTGFGRTGRLFAYEHLVEKPDIICLSKAITGGFLPMAATVCTDRIFNAFLDDSFQKAFAHGHSFTANPLGCAAAIASLKLFEEEDTLEKIARIEKVHKSQTQALLDKKIIEKVRILGSIAAFESSITAAYGSAQSIALRQLFLEEGLLIRPLGGVIYLIPPACISDEQLARSYEIIERVLTKQATS